MITVATPSTGWTLGYDIDGFLKQKDSEGVITQVGLGGTSSGILGTPSLSDILSVGNNTGTYSIQMGSGSSITTLNGNSYLQLDQPSLNNYLAIGTYDLENESSVRVAPGLVRFFSGSQSNSSNSRVDIGTNFINQGIEEDNGSGIIGSFQISATTSYYHINLSDLTLSTNFNVLEVGSTYDTGTINKHYLHLNSPNANTKNGVANSVIIGGENTTAEESNTVYVPQLVIRDGDKIKAGAGYGILEFNQYNDAILSTNKPFDNSIIGIFSSTSSSTHLTNKNGILVRDTLTSSTSPSWQSAVSFISTEFSNVEAGVYNTVIIGGNNLSATQSDTVYLGNNVNINNSYYLPTSDGTTAQALYTDGNGNLYWNTVVAQVSTFSLYQVLQQGNDTHNLNIVMGTGSSIESGNSGAIIKLDDGLVSGNILISTDNGSAFSSYIDMDQSDMVISIPNTYNLTFNESTIISNLNKGLEYGFDYSSSFATYSLVDKNYVDSKFLSASNVDNTSIELNGSNEVSLKSSIDGNRQFNDSVTILGDLIIQGTTSTIYTQDVYIEDSFITLNATYSGPDTDVGIEANINGSSFSKILYNSSFGYWQVGLSGSESTIITEASNGLSKVGNTVILGGTLSQSTIIEGETNDLRFYNLSRMTVTASDHIEHKSFDADYYSQNYLDPLQYFSVSGDIAGNTFSQISTDMYKVTVESYDSSTGGVALQIWNQDQAINDGSTNNRFIVADKVHDKGIVYLDDYSANFTTYSLVSKGYVDSMIGNSPGNGLQFISPGVIGLGGTLSQDALIKADGNNFNIGGLSRLRFTASSYIETLVHSLSGEVNRIFSGGDNYYNKVYDSSNLSYSTGFYIDNLSYASMTNAYLGSTYSTLSVSDEGAFIEVGSGTGSFAGISTYNYSEVSNDGSTNNSFIVRDDFNNKGLVYLDDYSGQFTTHSLISKGYADSVIERVQNGLTYSLGNIEIGGNLTKHTTINGGGFNFSIENTGIMVFTSSISINKYVDDSSGFTAQSYLDSGTYYTTLNYGNTYSQIYIDVSSIEISSINEVGDISKLIIYNEGQSILDGSTDNKLIVFDTEYQKGLVYDGDYTANFTTHSLVTKGYVDSVVSTNGTSNYIPRWQSSTLLSSTSSIYDNGLNVGIGLTTPTAKVHIKGTGTTSSTYSLKVDNSSNKSLLSARNDGFFVVGDSTISSYIWVDGPSGQFGISNESGFPYLYLNSSFSGGKFYFSNGSSGSGAFAQINTTNGNWLIGSPNTTVFSSNMVYKLEVAGTVSTTGFRMTSGATAGYVLTSDASGNATWNQRLPYKVYTALLSQSGTASPTSVGLENTFGITATFSYISTGYYELHMTGQFTSGKTFIINGCPDSGPIGGNFGILLTDYSDTNKIRLSTLDDNGVFYNGMLNNTSIEIRVYP